MRTHKLTVAIVSAALAASAIVVLPAEAAQTINCTDEFKDFTIDPGLGREGSSGVVDSHGQSGTLNCGGKQGTISFVGGYGTKDPDVCTEGGEGTAVFTWVLDGKEDSAYVTYEYGALKGGVVGVILKGQRLNGEGQVTPTEGDCATTAITKGKAVGKITLALK
jgi:hypothetical protein